MVFPLAQKVKTTRMHCADQQTIWLVDDVLRVVRLLVCLVHLETGDSMAAGW